MTAGNNRNGTPAIVVDNLRKEFFRNDGRHGLRRRKRVAALDGVTFEVGRGETVAILGQNGSGKSTLIRLLSTLLLHDGGAARIFAMTPSPRPAVRRLINRVSVEASFFKKMSAVENLSYAARLRDADPRDAQAHPRDPRAGRIPEARMNEPLEDLSRGMQQKVALARALLTAPSCSWTSRRPASTCGRSSRCRSSSARSGASTTRPSSSARTTSSKRRSLADRVGILDRGRLIELATADELKRKHGAKTLEEAFFAATGKSFEDEVPEEDDD